jgi:hypothetical protein
MQKVHDVKKGIDGKSAGDEPGHPTRGTGKFPAPFGIFFCNLYLDLFLDSFLHVGRHYLSARSFCCS